jgi:hypothetical protein
MNDNFVFSVQKSVLCVAVMGRLKLNVCVVWIRVYCVPVMGRWKANV